MNAFVINIDRVTADNIFICLFALFLPQAKIAENFHVLGDSYRKVNGALGHWQYWILDRVDYVQGGTLAAYVLLQECYKEYRYEKDRGDTNA
jgi:hypothetical protein